MIALNKMLPLSPLFKSNSIMENILKIKKNKITDKKIKVKISVITVKSIRTGFGSSPKKKIFFLVIFIIAFLMLRTVLKIFGAWPEWL